MNPYEVLGVPNGSSLAQVLSAFRNKVKSLHPDLNPDPVAHRQLINLLIAKEQIEALLHPAPPSSAPQSPRPSRRQRDPLEDWVDWFIAQGQLWRWVTEFGQVGAPAHFENHPYLYLGRTWIDGREYTSLQALDPNSPWVTIRHIPRPEVQAPA